MLPLLKILCTVGAIVFLLARAAYPAGKPHSTSSSRQFIVYGADLRVRGAMCDLAERTKANLLRLLDLRDHWKPLLIINLDYPQANFPDASVPQLDFSQLGYGLKLQLNLLVKDNLQGSEVQRQLLRAILIELMYRGHGNIAAGTPYVAPPDWLVDGILELQPGRDSGENAKLLQAVVNRGKSHHWTILCGKGAGSSMPRRGSCMTPMRWRSCNSCSMFPADGGSSRSSLRTCPLRPTMRWRICVCIFLRRWGVPRANGGL